MLFFPHQPVHNQCLRLKPAQFLFASEELHGEPYIHAAMLGGGEYWLRGIGPWRRCLGIDI